MRVGLYARVSTSNGGQNPETQLIALRDYCTARKWSVVGEYVDRVSGSKESRPSLDRLVKDAKQRRFDCVLVWKLDRFGRSLKHLLNSLELFNELGVSFVSLTDSIDLSTAQGKLLFSIIGAMAQFERELIRERVKAGLARARSQGHLPGRKRQTLDLPAAKARIGGGESLRRVAASFSVSPALLSRRLKEIRDLA
jgi:DNA invertase Pin-like site-specific DNA recombinase